MPRISLFIASILALACMAMAQPKNYRCDNGYILLKSEADLELIEARSQKLRGIVDVEANTFAWAVEMTSFEGFNSALQREHFNENYLESAKYPKATFNGKIIEKIDLTTDGVHSIRAKGKLLVHGIEKERIIKVQITVKGKKVSIASSFTVPISDYNIEIPRIVYQKIAEEITITVKADMTPSS